MVKNYEFPKVNAYLENNKYVIEANVAGWPKDKIHLEIEEQNGHVNLYINGEDLEKRNLVLQELERRAFYRVFKLEGVQSDPKAKLEGGILKIVFNVVKTEPVKKVLTIS